VNVWLVAAGVLSLAFIPCAVVVLCADVVDRVVGFEMAAACLSLVLLLLAEAYGRTIFFDLALALALLSYGGGLVFARFLERWL
jgi:multicomponent Na+:H+ antiporter subunit F